MESVHSHPTVLTGEVVEDPQLDPLLAKATADPEGRALVTAILARKEQNVRTA